MDVSARVAALQSFYLNLATEIAGRYVRFLIGEFGYRVYSSRTADEEFAFVFRVEVQQDVAVHKSFFQGKGTGQSCLFVDGEQTLQRAVLNGIVCQDGQFGSYTDTVVGSQSRSLSFQPFAVDDGLDGVGHEIVLYVIVLFADHVDVRLQHHGFAVFHAGSGSFFYQDVAHFIRVGFQLMFLAELLQIGNNLFLVFGGTRYLADFLKIVEYAGRFQFFLFHII